MPSAFTHPIFSLLATTLAWVFRFLSIGFEVTFSAFVKMSEDKKVVGDSKLSLSEEMHLGFLEAIVSAFRDRGVPRPTSECRRVPQPRWVEREAEREGGKRGGRRPA